jgi:CheY-specific phosphatase CheX
MNIDKEVLTKLAKRTIDYLRDDLSMVDISEKYSIEDVDSINYLDISALVSLSKDLNGTIGMSVSRDFAHEMVKNFIYGNMDPKVVEDLSSENVAETLNITLGNILQDIDIIKSGGKVEISTPYIMHNSVSITKKENGKMSFCKLTYNDEEIILTYFM